MKFLGKLLLTAINATLAFAAINDKQQHDDTFDFWVSGPSGGTATLVGLRKNPTTAKSLTIPAYVYVEGIRFRVEGTLDHVFSGNYCPFETISVSSNVPSFHFDHYSFNDCKNLKYVYLYNDNVTTELTAFKNVNKDVVFYSKGTKSFVNDYIKKEHNSVINFNNLTVAQQKEALFDIAKTAYNSVLKSNNKGKDSVAANLVTRYGSSGGYCRLFRLRAIAAGFPEDRILLGGDRNGLYWNYVRFGNYWYNVDINFNYRTYSTYKSASSSFYLSNTSFKNHLKNNYKITIEPSNFLVWYTVYGYPDEFRGQQTNDYLDNYVRSHGGYRW